MRLGDHARLEALARIALREDTGSALAWFYLGYALAAQGRFEEAIGAYLESQRYGLGDPKVHYQLGYSAHRAGRHTIACGALEDFLALRPEDPNALYYLGCSQLELGKADLAERTFTRLLERPSRWSDLGRLHRGRARSQAGRTEQARQDFALVAAGAQDGELRERARRFLNPAPEAPRPPPPAPAIWSFAWQEKAGYDSNVLRLPSTSSATSSGEGDAFLLTFLSAAVDPFGDGALSVRLSLLDLSYAQLHQSSLDAVLLSVTHEWVLRADWVLESGGDGDLFLLDRESFFQQAGLKGTLRGDAVGPFRLRTGVTLVVRDYQQSSVDALDGRELGALAELALRKPPEPFRKLLLRYQPADVTAVTPENAYFQHRLLLEAEIGIGGGWGMRANARIQFREFGAVDPGFGLIRFDLLWGVRAALTFDATGSLQLFLETELERQQSNIGFYDYERATLSLGLILAF